MIKTWFKEYEKIKDKAVVVYPYEWDCMSENHSRRWKPLFWLQNGGTENSGIYRLRRICDDYSKRIGRKAQWESIRR